MREGESRGVITGLQGHYEFVSFEWTISCSECWHLWLPCICFCSAAWDSCLVWHRVTQDLFKPPFCNIKNSWIFFLWMVSECVCIPIDIMWGGGESSLTMSTRALSPSCSFPRSTFLFQQRQGWNIFIPLPNLWCTELQLLISVLKIRIWIYMFFKSLTQVIDAFIKGEES